MPLKSHKYGFKLYMLVEDDGLAHRFLVYAGAADQHVGGMDHTKKVVLKLMDGFLGEGRSLFMDNYYNSVQLSSELLKQKTHTTGTIRASRKGTPTDVVKAKLKKGETIQRWSPEGINVAKRRDKREVMTITTEFSVDCPTSPAMEEFHVKSIDAFPVDFERLSVRSRGASSTSDTTSSTNKSFRQYEYEALLEQQEIDRALDLKELELLKKQQEIDRALDMKKFESERKQAEREKARIAKQLEVKSAEGSHRGSSRASFMSSGSSRPSRVHEWVEETVEASIEIPKNGLPPQPRKYPPEVATAGLSKYGHPQTVSHNTIESSENNALLLKLLHRQ
ncbi:hypothetical protein GE061_001126 [Apolygus lucorum]|uniref:PiggyBac transposable element-derived protein domain-containing protein n=1 Tax=Apolygus lucorum TaxID=248454 RepID=A0A8S9Y9F7_APOLU|nr:hypothetical protein GE061_001126 [Apolygus lucorum]